MQAGTNLLCDNMRDLGMQVGGAFRSERGRKLPVLRVLGSGAERDDARQDEVDAFEDLALHVGDDSLFVAKKKTR